MNPCDEATADFETPLQEIADGLTGRRAVYVSVPITSGWRFLAWYGNEGRALRERSPQAYAEAHARAVQAVNCEHAAKIIAAIEQRYDKQRVLEPVSFERPGWSQQDYRCFWGKVIERFVDRAVFVDGWEASAGCVYEFSVADRHGIATLDERDMPIRRQDAVRMIEDAMGEMTALGLDTHIFRTALRDLRASRRRVRAIG